MPQLAGAGEGAASALEQIVKQRLEEQALQARIAERIQQAELEQRRLAEIESQNRWERDRATKLDDERRKAATAAADREGLETRGRRNMAGVVAMGVDPQTARREIAFSSLQSGANVPSGVMDMVAPKKKEYTYTDPKTGNRSLRYADPDQSEPIDLGNEPQRPEKPPGPYVVGGNLVDASGKVIYQGKAGGNAGPSSYASERSVRTLQSVDELMGKVSGKTAGWGNLAAGIPASDAMNFASELDTLKANIAFNELTAMREASKTGGALGQVSNVELRLLESALGALNPRQSPENLRSQLQKIRDSIERWQQAQGATPTGAAQGVDPVDALIQKYGRKPK